MTETVNGNGNGKHHRLIRLATLNGFFQSLGGVATFVGVVISVFVGVYNYGALAQKVESLGEGLKSAVVRIDTLTAAMLRGTTATTNWYRSADGHAEPSGHPQ